MVWQQWGYVALSAGGALLYVGRVGRPAKVITSSDAVCMLISTALCIALVLSI